MTHLPGGLAVWSVSGMWQTRVWPGPECCSEAGLLGATPVPCRVFVQSPPAAHGLALPIEVDVEKKLLKVKQSINVENITNV